MAQTVMVLRLFALPKILEEARSGPSSIVLLWPARDARRLGQDFGESVF